MKILQWEPFDQRERARVGDQAEMYIREILKSSGDATFLRGPLVPIIDRFGYINGWRESDFLVYTQGTVFCIEVKNYTGRITYLPRSTPGQIWNGYRPNGPNIFDTSRILQTKLGRQGRLIEKIYTNPLNKTRNFIVLLKNYVGRVEPRFQRLFLIPVVCFSNTADISAIYNFQEGMIHIEHLPAFFQQHKNGSFAPQHIPWITETILKKIPNWDRVLTTGGEWINGILCESHLTFRELNNGRSLPNYTMIRTISWQPISGASYRQMLVTYTNGTMQTFYCSGGQLSLIRGEQPEIFDLRHLQQVVVGCANKLFL